MKRKLLVLVPLTTFLLPAIAYAQDGSAAGGSGLDLMNIVSTILFGLIGIALCVAGYFTFDKLAGLDLQRELVEDQNVAIGIMLAGVFIGIAIVVGAVMVS